MTSGVNIIKLFYLSLMVQNPDVRLIRNNLPRTNTLAYLVMVPNTMEKGFITLTSGLQRKRECLWLAKRRGRMRSSCRNQKIVQLFKKTFFIDFFIETKLVERINYVNWGVAVSSTDCFVNCVTECLMFQ